MELNMKSSKFIMIMIYCASFFLYACNSTAQNEERANNSNFTVALDNSGSIHKNNEQNINLTPSAVLKFSHSINVDTVTSKNITLMDSNKNSIKLQYDINDAKDMVSLMPDGRLKSFTKYQLAITNNLKDSTGTRINQTIYDFTTGSVATPVVTLINPGDQAKDTPLFPIISFQITSQIDSDTVNVNTIALTEFGDSHKVGISAPFFDGHGDGYSKYYIRVNDKLNPNTKYEISFSDQISDINGNKIKLQKFSFTTGTAIAPTVHIMAPKLDTPVSRATNIKVVFSQEVFGVTPKLVLLQNDATKQYIEIGDVVNLEPEMFGEPNFQYTFSPKTDLDHNTKYNIIFQHGIVDKDFNELKPVTYPFTTGDVANPSVDIIEPNDGETNIETYPTIRLHFSKQVQQVDTDTIELHKISPSGKTIPIEYLSSEDDINYSFSATKLEPATKYVVIVKNDIISTDTHDPLVEDSIFTFWTGNDVATTAELLYPDKNAYKVSLAPQIKVKFSREVANINPETLILGSCKDVVCKWPEPVPNYTIAQQTDPTMYVISLAPNTQLTAETQYKIKITDKITDKANTPVTAEDFTFTTGTNIVPKVSLDSNGNQMIIDKKIKFSFDGNMTGVDKTTVLLRKGDKNSSNLETNITTIDSSHYTIALANGNDNFDYSTTYFIIFNNGITDNFGNKLPSVARNLETGSEPNPGRLFRKIVGNYDHKCVLTMDYKIFCWGNNQFGQLGDGTTNTRSSPVNIPMEGTKFDDVFANNRNTCAIDDRKKVYCWGENYYGSIGDGKDPIFRISNPTVRPTVVKMPVSTVTFEKIAIGGPGGTDQQAGTGSCAIGGDKNSKIYCWGVNAGNVFGPDNRSLEYSNIPLQISSSLPDEITFYGIARQSGSSGNNTCALGGDKYSNKRMYCWGGSSDIKANEVKMPSGTTSFSEISSSSYGTCALGTNNRAYCWEKRISNDNHFVDTDIKIIDMPPGVKTFSTISTGTTYQRARTCGIGDDNNAYCWDGVMSPYRINIPNDPKLESVVAGDGSCALNSNGNKIYCWKDNNPPTLVQFP